VKIKIYDIGVTFAPFAIFGLGWGVDRFELQTVYYLRLLWIAPYLLITHYA
jgi:hypothetical protein